LFVLESGLFEGGDEVSAVEIVAFKEDWFRDLFGQGIGKAIPEIQARRMAAALAEIAISFASNARLRFSDRLHDEFRHAEEIVESPARNGIPAAVDDHGGFDVIDSRNAASLRGGNGIGKGPRFRFVAENGDDRGGIDNHRGRPCSL
jgi:hypothetical protein